MKVPRNILQEQWIWSSLLQGLVHFAYKFLNCYGTRPKIIGFIACLNRIKWYPKSVKNSTIFYVQRHKSQEICCTSNKYGLHCFKGWFILLIDFYLAMAQDPIIGFMGCPKYFKWCPMGVQNSNILYV